MNIIKISTLILLFLAFALPSHSSFATQVETEKGWYQKVRRVTTMVDWVGVSTIGATTLSTVACVSYHAYMNTPEDRVDSQPWVKFNRMLISLGINTFKALLLNQPIKGALWMANEMTQEVKITPKF